MQTIAHDQDYAKFSAALELESPAGHQLLRTDKQRSILYKHMVSTGHLCPGTIEYQAVSEAFQVGIVFVNKQNGTPVPW